MQKGIYRLECENPNGDPFATIYLHSLKDLKNELVKWHDYYGCRYVYVYKTKGKRHHQCIFSMHFGKISIDLKKLFGKYIYSKWGQNYYLWEVNINDYKGII